MDQYLGKLLDDRYEIQKIIGTGGMAVVYRAVCHRLNRAVAVKILKDEYSQDPEFRRRFDVESQAVAMLSHPNIVSVFDVSHTRERDYIVMELVDGISLKQYLEEKGTLNWREALHFATQIAKALEHAHGKGIIHRDIKPHNIMLLKDGSVKVADFGIAQICSGKNTLTREALGSVHYVSPEQAKGARVDSRTDIYSLGVVLYEMLTGKLPFEGETPVSVAIQHISAKAVMPRELNPSIPEGLEQITMKAMEADLNSRYASATELLADLEAFRQNPAALFAVRRELPEETRKAVPVHAERKRAQPERQEAGQEKKRNTALLIGIGSIALAVVAILCLFLFVLGDSLKPGEEIRVPDLRMESLEEMKSTYGNRLSIEVGREEFSDEVPLGCIISQDPRADRMVREGAAITVVVSRGKQQLMMPNLVNYSLQEAQKVLDDFDVMVELRYENSDVYTEDYVISTEPAQGAPLGGGQTVALVISRGASDETVPVPELVGMDISEALSLITEKGLSRGNIKYVDSELPKDTVTFQSLDQNAMVKRDTVINLHVSRGTERKAQVPSIVMQPSTITVSQNTEAALRVEASVNDGGIVTYEWFRSSSGLSTDLQPAGNGAVLTVDTGVIGKCSYCCKITNTLEESTASIYSDMVQVKVEKAGDPVTKLYRVPIPEGEGACTIAVKVDGADYMEPFSAARGQETVEVAVEATGTHLVEIYVDGILTVSQSTVFTD